MLRCTCKSFKKIVDEMPGPIIAYWMLLEFEGSLTETNATWGLFKKYYEFRTIPIKKRRCLHTAVMGSSAHDALLKSTSKKYFESTFYSDIAGCSCILQQILQKRIRCFPNERIVFYTCNQWEGNDIEAWFKEEFKHNVEITYYKNEAGETVKFFEFSNKSTLELFSGTYWLEKGLNVPPDLAKSHREYARAAVFLFNSAPVYLGGDNDCYMVWYGDALSGVNHIIWHYRSESSMKSAFFGYGQIMISAAQIRVKVLLELTELNREAMEKEYQVTDFKSILKYNHMRRIRWDDSND